jgi:formiminoglutamate deiminase
MTTYWAEQALLPTGAAKSVRFEVQDDRFGAVSSDLDPQPGDQLVAGLVLPGFANSHSHAFHRALRGRTQAGSGSFWTWRERMYAIASRLDPDNYFALARAVFAEMALAGMTLVGEFHYLHHGDRGRPYAEPNAMSSALAEAARQAGIRLTLLDVCYLRGGLDTTGPVPLNAVQERFSDGSVEAWAERMADSPSGPSVRTGAAVHSLRAVSEQELARVPSLLPPVPFHVHLSEQPAENDAVLANWGRTPTQVLDHHGLLGAGTTAIHGTHLTAADVERLGRSQTTVCFCPTTECDLADGIGRARALADAGCPLSLGSDSQAVIDMFAEMRGLEMNERLASLRRGRFAPGELLAAATESGYASLGWDGGGIAPGALADFVVVDPGSVRTAGSGADQAIYTATAADVTEVAVGGEWVVRAGQHRLGSVSSLLREALSDLDEST